MEKQWRADRHRLGWAVYRTGGQRPAAYRLPNSRKALTFPDRPAAAVWAQILNDRVEMEDEMILERPGGIEPPTFSLGS